MRRTAQRRSRRKFCPELLEFEFEFEELLLLEFEELLEFELDELFELELDELFEDEFDELLPATTMLPSAWFVTACSAPCQSSGAAGAVFASAPPVPKAARPTASAEVSFQRAIMDYSFS